MKRQIRNRLPATLGLLAVALLCLLPVVAGADESSQSIGQVADVQANVSNKQAPVIFSLPHQRAPTGLVFDLGDVDSRKLEIQISEPLTLNISNNTQRTTADISSVFLNNSLRLQMSDKVDITASLGAGKSQSSFQPLGSIYCQNGVLEQGSYRASDCHFINQANVLKQDQVAMGLRYGGERFNTALSIFKREASIRQTGPGSQPGSTAKVVMGNGLMTPTQASPLLPAISGGQPLSYLQAQTTGLDLQFQLGLTMDRAGEVKLDLQLMRVLDASYEAASFASPRLQNWNITNPFDSARLNLGWNKGNFSGGIQGFYREQIQFLNREDLDSVTTFDVHFTWRAPWNAKLSVGTTNVLNASSEDRSKADSRLQDPFESIYGRIPYVRYQQDL